MGKSSYDSEFPQLQLLGLYAAEIIGDGNCLFNALSDQIYGDQNRNAEIRERVVEYMREHKEHYSLFLGVLPGGATRRNPKRKAAGSLASVDLAAPSQAEIDRQFENYLATMGKGGTYGGNLELNAFSAAYNIDIMIYQAEFAYMVSASANNEGERPIAHIAYHTWEHYSSIRNLDGPHSGLPHVRILELSPEEQKLQKEKAEKMAHVQPWMIKVVTQSLPYIADTDTIMKALQEAKGNIDNAVSRLLDAEDRGSVSSTQGSSSIERDPDSDDDDISAPNKRHQHTSNSISQLMVMDSQESLDSTESDFARHPRPRSRSLIPDSDDDDSIAASTRDSSVSASSRHESPAPVQKLTLKLKQPRSARSPIRKLGPKTKVKQGGPQKRRGPTARERKELKKQAQKQARKERAQAAAKASNPSTTSDPLAQPEMKKASPGIETGFRTLYI